MAVKRVGDLLRGISRYPISESYLEVVALRRGLDLDAVATRELVVGRGYALARADLLLWLANEPNISQGGQSYSFSAEERRAMWQRAKGIYTALEEALPEEMGDGVMYGYKGSRL